jgi:hypothetical protein
MTDASLDPIHALLAQGFFLSAHDAAMTAIAAQGDSPALRHAAVLSLLRAGARVPALRLVEAWGLRRSDDPELAGLYPRLLKDIALDTRQRNDALAAADAYQRVWRDNGGFWHGINAAAMQLLAGDAGSASTLALQVAASPGQDGYWYAATRAEAALLLGDPAQAQSWLGEADRRAGADIACRAATRRQMRWEAALLGVEDSLLDRLAIPDTVHFCGLIPDAEADETTLRTAVRARLAGVGYAFGSLAAGGDIVVVEAALELGIAVTVLLPFGADEFVERSVRPAGAGWVARFRRCLSRVEARVLDTALQDDLDFRLVARRAMGLARLHAARLDSAAWQLAVWDGHGNAGALAGTAADVAAWHAAGGETRAVPTVWAPKAARGPAAAPARVTGAVLFSDLPRFSAYDDAALAAFYAGPLAAMGGVVDRAEPLYRNAWGDAVQLVFDTPLQAARCAFALRDALSPEVLGRGDFAGELAPRLALDFGALHPVYDAVQGVAKFAGRVMTRAARIEPVTPPGMIYATEAFACEIGLDTGGEVGCDYAGFMPTAKGYGEMAVYAMRSIAQQNGAVSVSET